MSNFLDKQVRITAPSIFLHRWEYSEWANTNEDNQVLHDEIEIATAKVNAEREAKKEANKRAGVEQAIAANPAVANLKRGGEEVRPTTVQKTPRVEGRYSYFLINFLIWLL